MYLKIKYSFHHFPDSSLHPIQPINTRYLFRSVGTKIYNRILNKNYFMELDRYWFNLLEKYSRVIKYISVRTGTYYPWYFDRAIEDFRSKSGSHHCLRISHDTFVHMYVGSLNEYLFILLLLNLFHVFINLLNLLNCLRTYVCTYGKLKVITLITI